MFNNCLVLVVILLLMIGYVYSSNNKKVKSGLSLIHVEISPNNEKLIFILAFLFILFSWYSSQPKNASQNNTSSSSYLGMNNGGSSYSGMNEFSFMGTGYMDNKKSKPNKFNIVSGLDNVFDKDSELVKNISNTVADIPKLIEQNIKGFLPTIDENSSLINVKVA